jgi:hypothetical protein
VDADVRISRGDLSVDVTAAGDRVLVRAHCWRAALALRGVASERSTRRRLAMGLHRALEKAGLTMEIRMKRRHIITLGASPRWNWLARLLGLTPSPVPVPVRRGK